MYNKSDIRNKMILKCKLIDSEYRYNASLAIYEHIKPLLDNVNMVAIYHARSWEADLAYLIRQLFSLQKKIYHPIAYRNNKVMQFEQCDADNCLNTKLFYPLDYAPVNLMSWYNLDLIFVPLVAIDKNGIRLGNGAGYYDTTFSEMLNISNKLQVKKRPILCGVGFTCQMVDDLPRDNWDISMDYFISESGLIEF